MISVFMKFDQISNQILGKFAKLQDSNPIQKVTKLDN